VLSSAVFAWFLFVRDDPSDWLNAIPVTTDTTHGVFLGSFLALHRVLRVYCWRYLYQHAKDERQREHTIAACLIIVPRRYSPIQIAKARVLVSSVPWPFFLRFGLPVSACTTTLWICQELFVWLRVCSPADVFDYTTALVHCQSQNRSDE
jgi:hypothetical protein